MKPPAVYQPSPARDVVQARTAAIRPAPPVYNPCQPRETVKARLNPSVASAIQRSKKSSVSKVKLTVAQHNWEILNTYSSAGKEIENAFFKAGYNVDNALDAIIRAIEGTRWKNEKIAHGLGNSTSKKRGGTDDEIQLCKEAILAWLEENPPQ